MISQRIRASIDRQRQPRQRENTSSNCHSPTMLSATRSRATFLLSRRVQVSARRTYASSTNDQQESNPPKKVANVSKTNEVPVEDAHGGTLQESASDAENLRVTQAPNRLGVWSRSQNPRAKAMSGPRFEQTIMELQVSIVDHPLTLSLNYVLQEQFGQKADSDTARTPSCHRAYPQAACSMVTRTYRTV